MRRALITPGAVVVVGCTTDSDPGFADVMGHVMLASGLPLTSALVTVSCGGGGPELVPGDSLGRYQVSLEATVGDCGLWQCFGSHGDVCLPACIGASRGPDTLIRCC